MTDIDDYIHALLVRSASDLSLPDGYVRREEMVSALAEIVRVLLKRQGVPDITDVDRFAERLFVELCEKEVITSFEETYAGKYFIYIKERLTSFRIGAVKGNPIHIAAERVGARFFPDVFRGYLASSEEQGEGFPDLGVAPASNRLVTFSDNEVAELDDRTSEIIDAVETQNQISDLPGLRELVLGQLRAGRELIRAGRVRVYLLQLTLIETLTFLAKRYEKELIGSLAAALIAALASHLGVGG